MTARTAHNQEVTERKKEQLASMLPPPRPTHWEGLLKSYTAGNDELLAIVRNFTLKFAPACRGDSKADVHGPMTVAMTAALTAAVEYGKRQAGIPLTFSVNLKCKECKETSSYSFVAEASRDDYLDCWNRHHGVPGHRPLLYKLILALPDPDAMGQMELF